MSVYTGSDSELSSPLFVGSSIIELDVTVPEAEAIIVFVSGQSYVSSSTKISLREKAAHERQ